MTLSVTTADFLKGYGSISEAALREPVTITSHGRERLVLLSVEEYRRLKMNDHTPLYPWEMTDSALAALAVSEPPAEAVAFDHEFPQK